MKKLIAQGAEAKIFEENGGIIKDRFKKSYRIPEIDDKLRRSRTRREAKVLDKLSNLEYAGPRLIQTDRESQIVMSKVAGKKVRDILSDSNHKKIGHEIGEKIAKLHDMNIIHGDLTTSNMIQGDEVIFIDFGLSFFSHKIEDRAVDLHLLRQALESKHHTIWEETYRSVLRGYKESEKADETVKRIETVEKRGRYKGKR